jgi:hypothetical protein
MIKAFFQRLFRRTAVRVVVVQRDPMKLRLHEYRSNPSLVNAAAAVMGKPDFRLMLDVLSNEHPGFSVYPGDVPMEMRAIYQARGEGYTLALANLESMAKFDTLKEPLEATFEPPEEEK